MTISKLIITVSLCVTICKLADSISSTLSAAPSEQIVSFENDDQGLGLNIFETFSNGEKGLNFGIDNNIAQANLSGDKEKPSYAYSPFDLMKLAKNEHKIYKLVQKHYGNITEKMKMDERLSLFVKRYLHSLTSAHHQLTDQEYEEGTWISTNPLKSFKMIRRFAIDIPDIMEQLPQEFVQRILQELQHAVGNGDDLVISYPDVNDAIDSINSLLRIQRYYNYGTEDMSNGLLGQLQTNVSLSPQEAFEIGLQAMAEAHPSLAIEWIELALKKLEEDTEHYNKADWFEVHEELKHVVLEHDNKWDTWEVGNSFYFRDLVGQNYGSHMPKRATIFEGLQKESIGFRHFAEYGYYVQMNFMNLCSGGNLQTELEKSELYCWYETKKHPYFFISPLKMELLNKDPPLVQMYQILGQGTIDKIKATIKPILRRSAFLDESGDNSTLTISETRTSSQNWLDDIKEPFLHSLMAQVGFATGLIARNRRLSDRLQVVCYGTSHHYDGHLDAMDDKEELRKTGNRIATFMIYLNDVDVGGKTAFPVMGTAASPVAGSAVFWYNLKENGDVDLRTWHGGCPVVHGIKWVANKWTRSFENWKARKCSINAET